MTVSSPICQKSGLGDPNFALFRGAEIAKKREKSF
jgi:hypothetical protein